MANFIGVLELREIKNGPTQDPAPPRQKYHKKGGGFLRPSRFLTPPCPIALSLSMANPTERTPPSEAFVEDLTDREHVAFIQSFQDTFRAFYMTAPARVHGAQKNWVLRNVLGPFQRKFGAPSPAVVSVGFFSNVWYTNLTSS